MPEDKTKPIERAKKRLEIMVDSMRKTHEIGRMCMRFVAGDQWDEKYRKDREESFRPVITVNRLSNPVNIVVNKNAMEASQVKVIPFEDSDIGNAKVKNGLIKHIQFSDKSNAIEAYQWAFFCLANAGFGYWRVDAEYLNTKSFDQDLIIGKIEDPFSVYLDPDGEFAIILKYMRKDSFEDKYGDGKGSADFGDADIRPEQVDDVLIVEYWERKCIKTTLYEVEIPETITEIESSIQTNDDEVDQAINQSLSPQIQRTPRQVLKLFKEELEEKDDEGMPKYPVYEVLNERETEKYEIKQYLFSGDDELEVEDWPGEHIPIIGIYARKFKMESGEYFYKPFVYDSIDPQKLYNYYRSQDAELMMQIPKAVWQGVEGQFEGHEDEYDEAHKNPTSRLEYKPVVHNGQLAPPPQRLPPPQVSQGYYQNIQVSAEEIKATTGIFDPSLGAQGNEVAARAIIARQKQGDLGTYHFTTAINSGFIKTGIILLDQIPFRYDSARTIRIVGEDLADEVVKINQTFIDKENKQQYYDMTGGSYDLKIEAGSNTITRRQENQENMLELARYAPTIMEYAPDLVLGNFDFDAADELTLRVKAGTSMKYPQLFAMVEQLKGQGGQSSVTLMQLQQAQQQVQQLGQRLQQQGIQMQQMQKQVQNNKIKEAQIGASADIQEAKIKAGADIQKEVIKSRFNRPMPPPNMARGGFRQ
jgi:hypothetical protein